VPWARHAAGHTYGFDDTVKRPRFDAASF
jgi:hypothetical protein